MWQYYEEWIRRLVATTSQARTPRTFGHFIYMCRNSLPCVRWPFICVTIFPFARGSFLQLQRLFMRPLAGAFLALLFPLVRMSKYNSSWILFVGSLFAVAVASCVSCVFCAKLSTSTSFKITNKFQLGICWGYDHTVQHPGKALVKGRSNYH